MQLSEMSKDERSLLLYLESQATDYGGKLDARRMNADDFKILDRWKTSGFILGGRIAFEDIKTHGQHTFDHWVVLSEDAWKLAHEERRARADRLMAKLTVKRLGLEESTEETQP